MARASAGLLFAFALLGCGEYVTAGQAKPVVTPDGKKGFAVSCLEEQYCWEVAGRGCARGYEILSTSRSRTSTSRSKTVDVGRARFADSEERAAREIRSLLIQCK